MHFLRNKMAKSKSQKNYEYKVRKKENGKCYRCGKPLDRIGMYCKECVKKKKEEGKADRDFLKEHHICPSCRKEKLYGQEGVCESCKAKSYAKKLEWRNANRKEYNEQSRKYKKIRYQKNTENGLCYRCGKRKPDGGFKSCGICRQKQGKYRKPRGIPFSERVEKGICVQCNEKVKEGYKVCEKHYQQLIEMRKKQTEHYWQSDNGKFFGKKVNQA